MPAPPLSQPELAFQDSLKGGRMGEVLKEHQRPHPRREVPEDFIVGLEGLESGRVGEGR